MPLLPGGATAAMTSTPGAVMSGLSRSPPPARAGPLDENAGHRRRLDRRRCPTPRSSPSRRRGRGVRLDRRAGDAVDVDGRHEVEVGVERVRRRCSARIMPTPPAVLDREALVGAGVDAAVADHDLAGDLGRVEDDVPGPTSRSTARPAVGSAPGDRRVGRVDQRRGWARPGRRRGRCSVAPLPSVTVLVDAAVVRARRDRGHPRRVVRDACWRRGPLLPADAATKTPASAAPRNASSTGSTTKVCEPEIE